MCHELARSSPRDLARLDPAGLMPMNRKVVYVVYTYSNHKIRGIATGGIKKISKGSGCETWIFSVTWRGKRSGKIRIALDD